jgi:hypothetical protein
MGILHRRLGWEVVHTDVFRFIHLFTDFYVDAESVENIIVRGSASTAAGLVRFSCS